MYIPPPHPIAAVTHPDPYPYYADLVANRPLYRDETTGHWIASSAAAVTAVLTNDLCRVRPATEPVPRAFQGSAVADIFRHLVSGMMVSVRPDTISYRPSANTRIPRFTGGKL